MKSGLYGNSPYTLQTGGCGAQGEYIQVTPEFLTGYQTMETIFGPPGQVFVHEWAKYRYGVFEEFGYPGDSKYPMFYFKAQWTIGGQVNKITPNFCTNTELQDFTMEDVVTGGACNIDENTGLPDINCIPVIGTNNAIKSSIMALPFLRENDQFCDDTEVLMHNSDIPNKHNDMCNQQSTFQVIKKHEDFEGYMPNNTIMDRNTTFTLLRAKASSSFVLVLDASNSMVGNCKNKPEPCELRLDRMIQSATRWVQFDIRNGVPLGIVTFNRVVDTPLPLTAVTEVNRPQILKTLAGITTQLETCLGAGLRGGLEVLRKGNVPKGGVLIFLTDGQYYCKDGTDKSTIKDVIKEVKAQGVRVITIAFSDDADPDILLLAQETNGKAYFVPDNSGPEVINTAMQGSLTYQPSVPSKDVNIIIYQQTLKALQGFNFSFIIDDKIGKNVVVQMDFSGNPGTNITIDGNNTVFEESSGVFEHKFGDLAAGSYPIFASVTGKELITFLSIKVTAKAKSDTIPIMTNCWTSLGNNKADMSTGQRIAVIAKVLQGNNPVVRAKVVAYIERSDKPEPLEVPLFDAGSDPDTVANDGIYARYFTNFDPNEGNTRYSIKCQVEGTSDSMINQGFIDKKKAPENKSFPNRPTADNPICCGSNTIREDSDLASTGFFQRSSAGGSIEIEKANQVSYPPGRVTDLRGANNGDEIFFTLAYTATGLVLDSGTAKDVVIYYSKNGTDLADLEGIAGILPFLNASDVVDGEALKPKVAGTNVEIHVLKSAFNQDQQYFFKLETVGSNSSSWSNLARIFLAPTASSAWNLAIVPSHYLLYLFFILMNVL